MNPVKRFVLFASDDYYPAGGWDDFRGSYDTADEARAAGQEFERKGMSAHIVDLTTGEQFSP